MVAELLLIILVVAVLVGLFGTKIGKRLRLRATGTANEMIAKDASTPEGAKAHYNNAIDKKEEEYKQAYAAHANILGEISAYEKELRDLQKESMQLNINVNACIDKNDDDGAKVYLNRQQETDEKVDIIKATLKTLKEDAKAQKENVDDLFEQLNKLKAEKEKNLLILKTAQSTKAAKVVPGTSSDEEDKMLEKVREGIRQTQKEADGYKVAYENSSSVQQKRLDKKMKEDAVDKKLQELKAQRNK